MPNNVRGYYLVISTAPSSRIARRIARQLVTKKLAACVNVLPGVTSFFRWQGKLEQTAEALLLIKTSRKQFARLSPQLKKIHPYEVPEIIAVPIQDGSREYLNWIGKMTAGGKL